MRQTKEIIKEYRKENNLTAAELAEKLGVSQVFLTKIENEQKKISEKLLSSLKEVLPNNLIEEIILYENYKKTPDDVKKKLCGLEEKALRLENKIKSNARILLEEEFVVIPVRAKASAGNGYINLEECLYEMKIRKNGFHQDCYLIEVVGNSMEPKLEDGAFVVVDPRQIDYIKDKIYVVKFEDETYIKKVEIDENTGMMILKSVNPEFENKYITQKESSFVKILGRAVSFFYEGRL